MLCILWWFLGKNSGDMSGSFEKYLDNSSDKSISVPFLWGINSWGMIIIVVYYVLPWIITFDNDKICDDSV